MALRHALTHCMHTQAPEAFKHPTGRGASADPIAAVAASATTLVIARASGVVHRYRCGAAGVDG